MRLNQHTATQMVWYAKRHFGNNIRLYLFGSRVDDQKRGGDIDLFIETQNVISMPQQIAF